MLLDELHRSRNILVIYGKDIRRLATDQAFRRDGRSLLGLLAQHQRIQDRRRLITNRTRSLLDTCQGGPGQFADDVVIIAPKCQMNKQLRSVFSYRVARRRKCLAHPKKRSTKLRCL